MAPSAPTPDNPPKKIEELLENQKDSLFLN